MSLISRFAHRKLLSIKLVSTALAATTLALPSLASPVLKTDAANSSVSLVFKQMNVPVEAKFKQFSAQIEFDATQPKAAKAKVDIKIGSFDLGDPQYNQEVLKKEWLNAARFPGATFASTAMTPSAGPATGTTAGSKFDVTGQLSIKGKTQTVRFPLSVKSSGANYIFEGSLPISRLAFNIGDGEWRDTAMVADQVIIKFHLTATK